jgi:hypothetical protein
MISRNRAQFFWTFLFGSSCESLASYCRHGIAADWNRFGTHREFSIDYALNGPIPWKSEACRRAGTIHLGGSIDEIAAAERDVSRGEISERPFVLVAQQSLFDETRAPRGQHTLWAYCHVPFDCKMDMSERIESQIERFAPGFRDCVLACHKMSATDLARSNPNLTGGDINGGAANLTQLVARPILAANPYRRLCLGSTCVRLPRLRVAASMACAGIMQRARPCVKFSRNTRTRLASREQLPAPSPQSSPY